MNTKCEYYVDMGEHNKPLCEKRNYRPSDCESCPTYIKRLQEENAKLRELLQDAWSILVLSGNDDAVAEVSKNGTTIRTIDADEIKKAMKGLGVELGIEL